MAIQFTRLIDETIFEINNVRGYLKEKDKLDQFTVRLNAAESEIRATNEVNFFDVEEKVNDELRAIFDEAL